MEAKTKINNRLWQARRRLGLEQKQVARLLGHRTCDQVSRYERGDRLPNLKTALKLEIILQTPIREIFPDLYEQQRAMVAGRLPGNMFQQSLENETGEAQAQGHLCTFEPLLLQKSPSEHELDLARRHSIKLVRELGEAFRDRKTNF